MESYRVARNTLIVSHIKAYLLGDGLTAYMTVCIENNIMYECITWYELVRRWDGKAKLTIYTRDKQDKIVILEFKNDSLVKETGND